jgi:hypothetical protein
MIMMAAVWGKFIGDRSGESCRSYLLWRQTGVRSVKFTKFRGLDLEGQQPKPEMERAAGSRNFSQQIIHGKKRMPLCVTSSELG